MDECKQDRCLHVKGKMRNSVKFGCFAFDVEERSRECGWPIKIVTLFIVLRLQLLANKKTAKAHFIPVYMRVRN